MKRALALTGFSLLIACASQGADRRAASEEHALLTLELSSAGLRTVDARVVPIALKLPRAPERLPWKVLIRDGAGKVVFERTIASTADVRGQGASPDGKPVPLHASNPKPRVSVHVPIAEGQATVVLLSQPEAVPSFVTLKSAPSDWVELGSVPYPALSR